MANENINRQFICAVKTGNLEEATRLLEEEGACIDTTDENGDTLLMWALKSEHISPMRGIDTGCEDVEDDCEGVKVDYVLIAKFLINRGADVNAENKKTGYTPLTLTAQNDNEEIAKILLEKGADIRMKGTFKPIRVAEDNGSWKVAKAMVDHANRGITSSPAFSAKAREYDNFIASMVDRGCGNIEAYVLDGYTPLMLTAQSGNRSTARALIDKDASVNALDEQFKYTALMIASERGDVEFVKLLLESKKISMSLKNKYGDTALIFAVNNDHWDVAKVLVEYAIRLDDEAEVAAKC